MAFDSESELHLSVGTAAEQPVVPDPVIVVGIELIDPAHFHRPVSALQPAQ